MKGVTTLEQSRELMKILPLESADCTWLVFDDDVDSTIQAYPPTEFMDNLDGKVKEYFDEHSEDIIPMWSLSALLDLLPYPQLVQGTEPFSKLWQCEVIPDENNSQKKMYSSLYKDPVEACIDVIRKIYGKGH